MEEIIGIDGMSIDEIKFEINRGTKFVTYEFCISIILVIFRRRGAVYFIKSGESRVAKGLGLTFLTLILGWWSFPKGPFYTIDVMFSNLSGGKNVTNEILIFLNQQNIQK